MMSLEELKYKLAQVEELTLLDWLDITTNELVYYLNDLIEEKQDELRSNFETEFGENDDVEDEFDEEQI